MKKTTTFCGFIASALLIGHTAFAQFEGVIKFEKYKNDTTKYMYQVKGKQVRITEFGSDGSEKGIQLVDLDKKSVIALSPDRKLYMDASNAKDAVPVGPQVTKTSNKKKIAGYDCTEWIAKSDKDNTIISYWVGGDKFDFFVPLLSTLNRKDRLSKYFLEIPDNKNVFPLMGEEKAMDGTVKTTLLVTAVESKKLDQSFFEIPKGYQKFEK
jgi:hypothetical protein